jgi:hypothetical protein
MLYFFPVRVHRTQVALSKAVGFACLQRFIPLDDQGCSIHT